MSLFNSVEIVVHRYSGGHYNSKGKWVEEASNTFSVLGTVQPASGQKIATLFAGKKLTGAYTIYSETELRVANERTAEKGDFVVLDGVEYELVQKADWQNGLIDHYEYIAIRELGVK